MTAGRGAPPDSEPVRPRALVLAIVAAFSTYFCMYAFRKPFSAASYEGMQLWGLDLKSVFVVSQLIGYALSKVMGIKVCSEAERGRRAWTLVLLVLAAEVALLAFAVLPPPMKVFAIFANGLPLGIVWGLVVLYLEGRRTSEVLLAGLSCSFILASGVVKDVGRWLMSSHNVDQFWMPFMVGLIFLPGFLISVKLLDQVPPADRRDEEARSERTVMSRAERRKFRMRFLPGLALLMFVYLFLTAYRDFRDSFGVEIFQQLGYGDEESVIFTRSELVVAFGVLAVLGSLSLIRDNRRGLSGAFVVMLAGAALVGGSTVLLDLGKISGLTWMILCGLGSYLAYVPYGTVLFERIFASTRAAGTAVFAIYIADSIGYTGVVGVTLGKDMIAAEMSRLEFFRLMSYAQCIVALLLLSGSWWYFLRRSAVTTSPSAR